MALRQPWVLVSAGEPSGDRLAAPVVHELQCRWPALRFFGAGGARLQAAGMELRHSVEQLAVTGLVEAVHCLPAALRCLVDLAWQARRRQPLLALLVDYPGLNLRLAGLLKHQGIPVLYYGAPQRWAWLPSRAALLRGRVDRLAVTLPFEEGWFRSRGISARFVGHPLVDEWPAPGEGAVAGPVLGLLPGSRRNEIRRHLPLLLATLPLLPAELRPVLATLPGEGVELCRQLAPRLPQAESAAVLGSARVALCASGTATLEAALAGVPTVVFYRLARLSYAVAKHLVRVEMVALPNLVLGERVLPELLQEHATPASLASAARHLLDPVEAARIRTALARVRERLGVGGVAGRVAELALELVGAKPPAR